MSRRNLVILAVAVLAIGIAVAVALHLRRTPAETGSDAVVGSPLASAVLSGSPQEQFDEFMREQERRRAAAGAAERLDIQGPGGIVSVLNFYRESDFVLGTDEVVIAQEPGFTIGFDRGRQEFTILDYAVSAAEFSEIRTRSEARFLELLGIGAADACRLNVLHYVPSNPEEPAIGNTSYPFSSCG